MNGAEMVWTMPESKVFHRDRECPALNRSTRYFTPKQVAIEDAEDPHKPYTGRRKPCQVCSVATYVVVSVTTSGWNGRGPRIKPFDKVKRPGNELDIVYYDGSLEIEAVREDEFKRRHWVSS